VDTGQGLIWAELVAQGATVSCSVKDDGAVLWRVEIPSPQERPACGGVLLLRVQGHRCAGRHRGETVFGCVLSGEAVDTIRDQVGPLLCSASCCVSAAGRCSGIGSHSAVARGLSKGMFSSAGRCDCRDRLTLCTPCAQCTGLRGKRVQWWYQEVPGVVEAQRTSV
jgi:hypothetical protein